MAGGALRLRHARQLPQPAAQSTPDLRGLPYPNNEAAEHRRYGPIA
ncbi:hypothetical protein CTATCC11996_18337 [Comamonas testosteroni ATCC 11996]|nr:hypothetical protein CTATCC11996_18337 [Comamonas testosteroni ATCC 11996]